MLKMLRILLVNAIIITIVFLYNCKKNTKHYCFEGIWYSMNNNLFYNELVFWGDSISYYEPGFRSKTRYIIKHDTLYIEEINGHFSELFNPGVRLVNDTTMIMNNSGKIDTFHKVVDIKQQDYSKINSLIDDYWERRSEFVIDTVLFQLEQDSTINNY